MASRTVKINLVPWQQSFHLSRRYIRRHLPGSLLAEALEVDPDTPSIDLPHPAVTPEVLALMVQLAAGREPTKHEPALLAAHRYLNLPSLLYYAEPLCDTIPNRQNGAAPENKAIIEKALEEDRPWAYAYLVTKGYQPQDSDLRDAVDFGAVNMVRYLLTEPNINAASNDNYAIRQAARGGKVEIMRALLAYQGGVEITKRLGPGMIEVVKDTRINLRFTLCEAIMGGHLEIVDLLLADSVKGRIDPMEEHNRALKMAIIDDRPNIVARLLEDGRINPGQDFSLDDVFEFPIVLAVMYKRYDIAKMLLADPRVDPRVRNDEALKLASVRGDKKMVMLLLESR